MMTDKHINDARADLDRATELADRTRRAGERWMRIYLSIWAAASTALVLAIGLLGKPGVIGGLIAWGVIVASITLWSRRQGAIASGASRRVGTASAGWAVVYGVVLAVGLGGEITDVWFWVVGAVATAVPLVAAAIRCGRCAS